MSSYILFDGEFFESDQPILRADSRSYRYGDAVFETMRYSRGRIQFEFFNLQRLFASFKLLKYSVPEEWTPEFFSAQTAAICERNNLQSARIRLSVSRGNGHLRETKLTPSYLIEATPLPGSSYHFNEVGAVIDIFSDSKKASDSFSNIKSSNYLPYVMASIFAADEKLADAVVLNEHGRVCDTSIANIFIVKDGLLMTPSLKEGPVAGIVRRYIIEEASTIGREVVETAIDISMLYTADEMFLTNALNPITWVERFKGVRFSNDVAQQLYRALFKPLVE